MRLALAVLIAVAIVLLVVASVAPHARTIDMEGWPSGKALVPKTSDAGERREGSIPSPSANGWVAERQGSGPLSRSPRQGRWFDSSSIRQLSGLATWYAYKPGQGAAGPGLRSWLGSGWRGQTVTVTSGGRSVRVVLSDFCRCSAGRLIDLDSRAFARLGPLSAGVLRVVITRGGPVPTAPATDVR